MEQFNQELNSLLEKKHRKTFSDLSGLTQYPQYIPDFYMYDVRRYETYLYISWKPFICFCNDANRQTNKQSWKHMSIWYDMIWYIYIWVYYYDVFCWTNTHVICFLFLRWLTCKYMLGPYAVTTTIQSMKNMDHWICCMDAGSIQSFDYHQ